MPEKNNEANRQRKWAPKARTGCRTCKTRHVKCDEAKPICQRCTLSGFRCDGYPLSASKKKGSDVSLSEQSYCEGVKDEDQPVKDEPKPVKSECPDSPANPQPVELTALVVRPSQPYIDADSVAFSFFQNVTSSMVSRSHVSPQFWQQIIPQAAYHYPCLKHAVLAAAVSTRSLIEGPSSSSQSSELQIIIHTSKAVQSLLHDNIPLDVILLTSATLGILDIFEGRWETACKHVLSGARLAKQSMVNGDGNNFIAFYCEAFASALPAVLKQAEHNPAVLAPEKSSVLRLKEAVQSLELARESFEAAIEKTKLHTGPLRGSILQSLFDANTETEAMLGLWSEQLKTELQRTSPPDEALQINIHRVESPWSAVMEDLNEFLDFGGPFNFSKFDVAMQRTLPFYTLAKAGPNLKMREAAAQWMYKSAQKRLVTPPHRDVTSPGRISELENDNG